MENPSQIVKDTREKLDLTQEDFARLIGKTRHAVSDYETGRSIPRGDILLKIIDMNESIIFLRT